MRVKILFVLQSSSAEVGEYDSSADVHFFFFPCFSDLECFPFHFNSLSSFREIAAKCGFVKYRYRLHAETAKKDLNNRPAFGGQCPSLHIGERCLQPSFPSLFFVSQFR